MEGMTGKRYKSRGKTLRVISRCESETLSSSQSTEVSMQDQEDINERLTISHKTKTQFKIITVSPETAQAFIPGKTENYFEQDLSKLIWEPNRLKDEDIEQYLKKAYVKFEKYLYQNSDY